MTATAMRLARSLTRTRDFSASLCNSLPSSSHCSSPSAELHPSSPRMPRFGLVRSPSQSRARRSMFTLSSTTLGLRKTLDSNLSAASRSSNAFTLFATLVTGALDSPTLRSPCQILIDPIQYRSTWGVANEGARSGSIRYPYIDSDSPSTAHSLPQ
jgi:hypothetical protein